MSGSGSVLRSKGRRKWATDSTTAAAGWPSTKAWAARAATLGSAASEASAFAKSAAVPDGVKWNSGCEALFLAFPSPLVAVGPGASSLESAAW